MKKKFPFIATLVCLITVGILCRLGFWQIERLAWKNNLQAELDSAFSIESPHILNKFDIQNIESGEIIRGSLRGNIDISKPAYFNGRIQNGRSVTAVVVPFKMEDSDFMIPIEIGCIEKISDNIFSNEKQSHTLISGILRYPPKPSFVTPLNIPKKNEWWRFERDDLSNFWGIKNIYPILMTAENTQAISQKLTPCPIEKKLRNDHLSYAAFWFGMAFVLCVMWGIRFLIPYIRHKS